MGINPKFFHDNAVEHYDTRFRLKRSLTQEEIHNTLRELLFFFISYCKVNNIKPVLMYGGLIGCYFANKMLPWDDDLDIGLFDKTSISNMKEDFCSDENIIIEINPYSYEYSEADTENIISARCISRKNGLYIDIVYFKQDETCLRCKDGNVYQTNCVFPLRKVIFEGVEIFAPNDVECCLIQRYGKEVLKPLDNKGWLFKKGKWVRSL